MTTKELLSGLKPVTLACMKVFAPFYDERARHYVYPRFMQSVCALIDMGHCYYNIIRGANGQVLLIFKRTAIFGKLGVQMPVAPISLSGSVSDEKEAMKAALSVGISLRVTTEDITRYRIPRNLCSDGTGPFVPVNNEYIYDARLGSEMKGSAYRKLRYNTKRIIESAGFSLMTGAHPDTDRLVREWDERYKERSGSQANQTHLWQVIRQAAQQGGVSIRNILIGSRLECVSVIERLSEQHHIIVFRIRNYNSDLNDVGSAMQWIDCSETPESRQVFLNMGLADTDGLIHAKEALKPCRHQKIYTVKTNKTNSNILNQYFK